MASSSEIDGGLEPELRRMTKIEPRIGPHIPVDFGDPYEPYVMRLSRWFDDEGYERGDRINGFSECPKCGLWWPIIEEPDMWEEDDTTWVASGWWGHAYCDECELLMVSQPDGTPECYSLPH